MKILIVEPGKHPYEKEISGALKEMQKIVGGRIQAKENQQRRAGHHHAVICGIADGHASGKGAERKYGQSAEKRRQKGPDRAFSVCFFGLS